MSKKVICFSRKYMINEKYFFQFTVFAISRLLKFYIIYRHIIDNIIALKQIQLATTRSLDDFEYEKYSFKSILIYYEKENVQE